jgi:calcineurin-like phosphoesterase family protein
MNNVFFTSDTHFGHRNILEYEKEARPFSTVEEMNEAIIDRWNNTVGSRDIVYHLGDFCFGRANISIAERLKGTKRLVMGNHDNYPASDYLRYFEKMHGMMFYKQCILSHMPCHPDGLGQRWFLNLHGHLHSRRVKINNVQQWVDGHDVWRNPEGKPPNLLFWVDDRNYMNVSCEQNNLTPIHLDVIMERVKELTSG